MRSFGSHEGRQSTPTAPLADFSVLECVGTQESMVQAIKTTRPGGFHQVAEGIAQWMNAEQLKRCSGLSGADRAFVTVPFGNILRPARQFP